MATFPETQKTLKKIFTKTLKIGKRFETEADSFEPLQVTYKAINQSFLNFNKNYKKTLLSQVGSEPTPGEPDCDLNAAP